MAKKDSKAAWPEEEWPLREYTDELAWAALADQELCQHVFCAQASFLEFARVAEYERFRVLPTYEAIGIKAFFAPPEDALVGEHMFLTDVFTDGSTITATLAANSQMQEDLKKGQEVTFPVEKLSDWFLVRAGRGYGGFTISHMWNQLSDQEQRRSKNKAPFAWFWARGTTSAEDELIALPKCVKCKRRDLAGMGAENLIKQIKGTNKPTAAKTAVELCSICQSGSRRCKCPKCHAPLIRNEKLSKECARCS